MLMPSSSGGMPWDHATPWGAGFPGAMDVLVGRQSEQVPVFEEDSFDPGLDSPGNIFGIGGKFGRTLGKLGDALLIAGGGKPIYAQREQQRKTAEAMEGFADDPLAAIQRLAQMGHPDAMDAFDDYQKRQIDQSRADSYNSVNQDKRDKQTLSILRGLARSANPQTYSAVYENMRRYAKSREMELPFELPSAYDETLPDQIDRMLLAPKDEALIDYRSERLEDYDDDRGVKREAEGGRDTRSRRTEEGRNRRQVVTEDRRDRRQVVTEDRRDRREANRPGKIARPNISVVRDKDGKLVRDKDGKIKIVRK